MIDIVYYTNLLNNYKFDKKYPHELEAFSVCQLALKAAGNGNVGVGAIILNEKKEIIIKDHNRIFEAGFRSDLHAEMVVLNDIENKFNSKMDLSTYVLFSSLEPCPMCMTRIIFSGIKNIYYICPDNDGGMVQRKKYLPPVFQNFIKNQNQQWMLAKCSPKLKQIAFEIWDQSRKNLDRYFEPMI